ncbi:MAG: DUF1232 domain-containing protein [Gloeocapsa sp. DLM2.Bin57]|nr:MAG: DUF1232 domain-containing protein [Gloeocapsa sp. DLM2.Bin57]
MKQIVESFYSWYSNQVRNPKYRWLIVLGTIAYLFSPLDISPDVFPIIGWIDDGIVLTLLTTELSRLALDYRKNRRNEKVENSEENLVTVDSQPVETVIEVK